ncbi:restriction endonuclease subunit S [Thiorhodococcus minor]|uniref:Type I restriction modification DNA specificity domain-containing protein n=1 Tax=Thiorhodococcus minor TaxID=57489 RepID=A0A6M0JZ53_9GAMM|nr:restriction endonuclease subunit S [Thiorhodococcus minor]NEV62760.1 hypothetical protein [Thiorhodococcus minor]
MRDWRTEPLERVAEIRSSNVDKKSNPGEEPVRLCNYTDVYSRGYITEDIEFMEATATPAEIQRFGIERGDVMITKDSETPDDIGIPAVVVDDVPKLVCGYHVALIKPNRDKVDPVYLAKQLGLPGTARYYGRLANGSTRYGLSYQSISRTPIRLAPLPQQHRIAEILSTVDEAIEQTEALLAKTQQIKAGLMHDLFTRGVTADGQLRPPREEAPQLYKESPLGWIPKEWDVTPCGEVFDVQLGKMMSPTASAGPNQKPYLRNQNVYWDRFDLSDVATMHFSTDDEQKYRLKDGDLLACEGRFIGRCAVWRGELDECYYQKALHRLRATDPRVTTDYMQFFMSLRFELDRGFVEKMTHESTIPHLPLEKLVALPVLVPPRAEQEYLVCTLGALTHRDRIDRAYLHKAKELKAALMGDLLSGRVVVEKGILPNELEVAANV